MLSGPRVAGAGAGAGAGSDDEYLQACHPSTILVRSGRCASSPPVGPTLQRPPYGKHAWSREKNPFNDKQSQIAERKIGFSP